MGYFRPVRDIYFSFKKGDEGFSARKLTGFACLVTALVVCVCLLPPEDRLHAFYALLLCALLCFGLVTWENILSLRNGGKTIFKETIKTETNETTKSEVNSEQPA